MKILHLLFISALLCSPLQASDKNDTSESSPPLQSYEITVIEFHLKDAQSLVLANTDIAERFDRFNLDGKIEIIETVQLSAVTGFRASALFGGQIPMTQGVTRSQMGETRNMHNVALGTGVSATVEPHDDKLVLSLEYQSSRVHGEIPKDSSPDIATIEIKTSLVFEKGQRKVLGGTTAMGSTFILVMVTDN